MTHPSSARWLVLGAAVTLGCGGTETDNPVVGSGGYESPERFAAPEPPPPGCIPLGLEELPSQPLALARSLWLDISAGSVLAVGDDYTGLSLLAAGSDAILSAGAARGSIHELAPGEPGELWVAATEPPALSSSEIPSAEQLEASLKLIQLDVSDASHPVRGLEATLPGDHFKMWRRGDEVWLLSGRRVPEQRGCDGEPHPCGWAYYEALELQGYRPSAGSLEPIAHAEVPFALRAWLGVDGVVSAGADGAWHVLYWDDAGALQGPELIARGEDAPAGPAEVRGGELWALSSDGSVSIFELGAVAPPRNVELPEAGSSAGVSSLFWEGRLWLTPPEGNGLAELWQLDAEPPARIALPALYSVLLPIEGARFDARPDAVIALGRAREASGSEAWHLLAVEGTSATLIEDLGDIPLSPWPGNRAPAPPGLRGTGPDTSSFQIVVRGAGLPLGLDPAPPPGFERRPFVRGFVSPSGSESAGVEAAWIESYVESGVQPNPRLEVTRDGILTGSFELSPMASGLVPTPRGVAVLAAGETSECSQSGRDCTGHVPGVMLFDLSGEPALVAEVALPQLPVPDPAQPFHVSATWGAYDGLSGRDVSAWPLADGRIAFVADVSLSCDDAAECEALGLSPLPFSEAGVAAGNGVACPPGAESPSDCGEPLEPPAIYGQGRRQYFFALDLAASEGPRFVELGVSALESSSGFPDRDSRFAPVRMLGGLLVATRLERYSASGTLLPPGRARIMMDRFGLNPAGEPLALAPVNVPGQPMALLAVDPAGERWISVEPLPGETGEARLHRLQLTGAGAAIEASLALPATFGGFGAVEVAAAAGPEVYGVALAEPESACGSTRVQVIALGGPSASGELTVTATLELPSVGWRLAAIAGAQALLEHDRSYVLLEVGAGGELGLVSAQSSDGYLESEQLSGGVLRAGGGRLGPIRLTF